MLDYSFGNWIKRRRKALDLTQRELAQRVGCSLSLIYKIEADERRPSRQIAELLVERLEIPPDQRDLFLKVARQDKGTPNLKTIPPLSTLEPAAAPQKTPSNLPISPTPLVGRENEIRVITMQLLDPTCRLLTLTGSGGVGKTRLAIASGRQLETRFADGVAFVSLAGIGMNESIIPVIADALGLAFSGPAEPLVQLTTFLHTKETLLVVDNMEHLLDGANLLGEILRGTQHVKMLVTSREQLHLQWEWLFEVQGLPIPDEADVNLESNSAVMLFAQRAMQTLREFSLDAEDKSALVTICKLVGGLPLAIELAASWVRMLSCREIANELERNLDILETKKLDVPVRHRSLKAVFDHSWELLTEEERLALMRLSVFQGGFTRKAAYATADASLPMLSSLMDKSLLRYNKSSERYDLHELIRQYTYAELQSDPGEEAHVSEKHTLYYANWIASLEGPFKSAQQAQTSQLIRSETSNWLTGWHWSVEQGRLDILMKMSPCLNWYFEVHGYYDEALFAFKAALDRFRVHAAPNSLQSAEEKSAFASLLDQVGWFEFRKGNIEQGAALMAESLELAREYNDPEVLYYIYGNWGYLSLMTGEISEAERLTTESLKQSKTLTPWHTAIPISVLGIVAYQQGRLTEAFQQLSESLEIWRSVGDPRGLVFCMLYLGMTAFALNDIPTTRSVLEESNEIAKANMDRWAQAFGLDMLGMVALSQDQNEEALVHFEQSIALSKEIGDQLNSSQTTIHLGQAHAALQSDDEAKRLFLEAYASAKESKWTLIILNALLSFTEMQNGLSAETRLGVALSVLSHPSVTPYLRPRGEQMRDKLTPSLTTGQIEVIEKRAKEKRCEDWAQEILK